MAGDVESMKSFANPIMLVTDNPCLHGGLSRMGRDLATLACTMPEFRVAYLGRGIGNKYKLPFTLYQYPESGQWGEGYIQQAWEDFSAGEQGIIITLDDPSRRHWLVNPVGLPPDLQKFLGTGRNFQRWGYFPIDSAGPNGTTLPLATRDCLSRYDRVLVASEWAADLAHNSNIHCDWLPHGYLSENFNTSAFQWSQAGKIPNKILVGSVMANQSRKDFPALFTCFSRLKQHYGNQITFWIHTNALINYWNLHALAADYGIGDELEVTMEADDRQLALRYSSCDCTVLPTRGEGFGYPIVESLACGTPCVTTGYGGGAELVPGDCQVDAAHFHVDTAHNCLRAYPSGLDFAQPVMEQVERKRADWELVSSQCTERVAHLRWDRLRYQWERWLREGLA